MKHLKLYKLFESISKQDIIEMCYDLTDIGFEITFRKMTIAGSNDETCITIEKTNGSSFTLDNEIIDIILRIVDYVGDRFDDIGILSDWPIRQWTRYFKEIPKKYNPGQKIKLLSELSSTEEKVTVINLYINPYI